MPEKEIPTWRDINAVHLRGRLGRDPEVRSTASGGSVVNFTLATSEKWKDKATGDKRERTEWHKVASFAENHVNTAASLKKGDRVELVGTLQTREWTDNSGGKRYTTEIVLRAWDTFVMVPEEPRDGARAAPKPASEDIDDSIPF